MTTHIDITASNEAELRIILLAHRQVCNTGALAVSITNTDGFEAGGSPFVRIDGKGYHVRTLGFTLAGAATFLNLVRIDFDKLAEEDPRD